VLEELMTFNSVLLTAAASLVVFGIPSGAQPEATQPDARAEQAADQAVADARAEVVAEARADAQAQESGEATAPITISDVRQGSAVHDPEGGLVGTVESVDERGAVVSTGRIRARLPFSSFARNARGLVISLTRAELEAAAAAQTPS
jgi:hypothetical protein